MEAKESMDREDLRIGARVRILSATPDAGPELLPPESLVEAIGEVGTVVSLSRGRPRRALVRLPAPERDLAFVETDLAPLGR